MAAASSQSAAELLTQQAAALFKQGKSGEACTLERQAIAKEPSNWLAHATMSYFLWYQGNVFGAAGEGQLAIKLNPNDLVSLTNLALITQNANNYPEALSLYRRAANLAPASWVAPLGIARCYILEGDQSKGLRALRAMSEQKDGDFDWYFMTAKTWLELEYLEPAQIAASKAIEKATTQEQRSAAQNLLLLTLLRANKFAEAKSLQAQVINHNLPRQPEIYVRTALNLLSVNDPASGKNLLDQAIANLNTKQVAETFLNLGRVFEKKAADPTCAAANRASWQESAQAAYVRAIELSPASADYHLALAGLLNSKRLMPDAVDELKKTASLDRNEILCPYLVAKILNGRSQWQTNPIRLPLSLIRFKINGLTCSCQLSKIYGALKAINGVAFISTPPQKPYQGLVLADQALTPASEMLHKCGQNAFPAALYTKGAAPNVAFELVSEEPIETIDAALKLAEEIRFGPILSFRKTFAECFNRFKEIAPIMPVSAPDADGLRTAYYWSASL